MTHRLRRPHGTDTHGLRVKTRMFTRLYAATTTATTARLTAVLSVPPQRLGRVHCVVVPCAFKSGRINTLTAAAKVVGQQPYQRPMSVTDNYRVVVADLIASTDLLPQLTKQQIFDVLEEPRVSKNGDIALPVPALKRFMKIEGNPADLAKAIHAKLTLNEDIAAAEVAGPFINFKYNKKLFTRRIIEDVMQKGEQYGFTCEGNGRTVIVEFSSPNIAKPFHAGHLRSTIIGNFTSNILKGQGYKVIRMNYLGDWGKQYGLLAVGYERFGSAEKLDADPIKHLFDVYVHINQEAEKDPTIHDLAREYFKRMEDGDDTALGLWRKFRDLSISKYKEIYSRLNVEFDEYSGESFYGEQMKDELEKMVTKNLLVDDQGALIFDMSKEGMGKAVIRKSNGTTLYITRDVAAAHDRVNRFQFDKMIYVVASQQELHFRQLFHILKQMGYEWTNKCEHVSFGMVKGMKTRKGDVVFLEDILEESAQTMHELMKKNEEKYAQIENPEAVADIIGLSAVVVQDMGAKRIKDYDFNWSRMISFEGDTGPYLQYTHARVMSIERKAGIFDEKANPDLLTEASATLVIDILSKYPNIVRLAARELEPNTIVNYSFTLAHAVSSLVEELRVIGTEKELAQARLLLFRVARITLGNCLRMIGLKPLERM